MGSQGFGWYLGRRVHDLPRLSRDLVPNFHNKARSPENFSSKLPLSEKNQAGCFLFCPWETRATKLDQPWKPFPFEFSAPTPREKKGSFSQEDFLDGVSTCSQIFQKPQQCFRVYRVFVPPTLWLFEVANWLISCISMWFGIFRNSAPLWLNLAELRWKGVACVKIAWMIKKAYFSWRLWFVISQ